MHFHSVTDQVDINDAEFRSAHLVRRMRVAVQASGKNNPSSAIAAGLPDRDVAENTIRLLTEDLLQRIVTAFQRFAEALYDRKPGRPKLRRNAFQNLGEGSRHWKSAFGKGYDAHLSAAELAQLNRGLQQRHLLAHREGLVDADYIAKTGDQNYRDGQRLVIREAPVRECLAVEKLGAGLAGDFTGQP